MAREPFLINPPRRRRRKAMPKRRRTVRKRATRRVRKRVVAPARKRRVTGRRRVHRPVLYEVAPRRWSRSPKSRSRAAGVKINPFGEEVLVVGNPRRRKRRRARRNDPGPAYRRRRRHNEPRRRRRRSYRMHNPVRRHRRRYRRNPAFSMRTLTGYVAPVLIGVGANIVTEKLPQLLGMTTTLPKLAVQGAVAFGVPMIFGKMMGRDNARIWTIVSLATLAGSYLRPLIGQMIPQLAGFSEVYPEIHYGAYPAEQPVAMADAGYGAYPEEVYGSY